MFSLAIRSYSAQFGSCLQLSSGLAGKYEVKEVHTVFIKTCIKHAVFITFAFRSNKKWEIMKPRV